MEFDIIIVGGGPAGISAGIYAKRAGKNVAIIEKVVPGGQLNYISEINNYTGFTSISGVELAQRFYSHAENNEIKFIFDEVKDVDFSNPLKVIKCKKGEYFAKAVIFALGSHSRELNIEGEEKFKGKGVSYCAVCDGNFFKDEDVAVVGSGDTAFSDASYLSGICKKVYLLTKEELKNVNYPLEILNKDNIEVIKGGISSRIEGEGEISKLIYIKDEKENALDVKGVFVAIGRQPSTQFLNGKLELTDKGFIVTHEQVKTSRAGVFACGDVCEGHLKQIVSAVGDGAVAGLEASKFVSKVKTLAGGEQD